MPAGVFVGNRGKFRPGLLDDPFLKPSGGAERPRQAHHRFDDCSLVKEVEDVPRAWVEIVARCAPAAAPDLDISEVQNAGRVPAHGFWKQFQPFFGSPEKRRMFGLSEFFPAENAGVMLSGGPPCQ